MYHFCFLDTYCAIGAINLARARHIVFPEWTFADCIPLLFCAFVYYARQTCAIIEGFISYARHAVANCYARQPAASTDGTRTYARHTVRDNYVRQSTAIIEGT